MTLGARTLAVLISCGLAMGEVNTLWDKPGQWDHQPNGDIHMNLGDFVDQGSKPPSTTALGWYPTRTEKQGKSFTNGIMGGHPVLIVSKGMMRGKEMPNDDDQVLVYAAQMPENPDLERSDGTIILTPVKPSELPGPAGADDESEDDLERRLKTEHKSKHKSKKLGGVNKDKVALLQVGEMAINPLAVAAYWGTWGTFAAAGITTAWMAGAAMNAANSDLERSDFNNFPSLEMKVANRMHPIKFQKVADLEMFLPAAVPLLFFPWGLALGASYYSVGAAAATEMGSNVVTAVSDAAKSAWSPWFPFASASKVGVSHEQMAITQAKMQSWYWNSLWAWHLMSLWYLTWQMKGYFWMYLMASPNSPWSKFIQPTTDFWKGMYTSYVDKLKEAKIPFNPMFPWLPLPAKQFMNLAVEKSAAASPSAPIVAAVPDQTTPAQK